MRKLNPKEKQVATLGALALAVLLYLTVFLLPTLGDIHKYQTKLKSTQADIYNLENLIKEHRTYQAAIPVKREGSLLSFVEQKAAELKLQDQIGYLRPFGDKGEGAELKIEAIRGSEVIKFIYELQKGQVKISQLQLNDFEGDGTWVAKLFLEE